MDRAEVGRHLGRRRVARAATLVALLVAGCQRQADITLSQPHAPPSQQQLKLISDGAYVAQREQERVCLLTFALPGSMRGPRAFVIYFCGPDADGRVRVDPQDAAGIRGFLIQEVGALAGRTDLVDGVVTFRSVPWQPERMEVELDVRCEDGTTIRGKALAESFPTEVRAFERQYAADVASLNATAPSDVGPPTHGRALVP